MERLFYAWHECRTPSVRIANSAHALRIASDDVSRAPADAAPPRPRAAAGGSSRCRCSCCSRSLATTPLWLPRVGLYQYLALEIVIWMIYALGYNLLLGYIRPAVVRPRRVLRHRRVRVRPAAKLNVWPNLWLDLAGAVLVAALRRRAGGRVHLAPARHLLRAADDRVRPGVLVRRDQVALGDRRRGRPPQPQAAAGRLRLRRAFDLKSQRGAVLLRARACSSLVVARAAGGSCIRRSAACSQCIRQNETRARFLGYHVWLYKWLVFVLSAAIAGTRRRAVRDGAAVGVPERDEPAPVGLRRDDGADRRRARELLGSAARRARSSSSRATCSARTPRPGCSGTACCSWRSCCGSRRASPACGRTGARDSARPRSRAAAQAA